MCMRGEQEICAIEPLAVTSPLALPFPTTSPKAASMRALLVLLFLCGCGARGGVEPLPEDRAPEERRRAPEKMAEAPTPSSHHDQAPDLPEGHPAVGDIAPPTNAPAAGASAAGGIAWSPPADLVARPPASSMRVAEYGLGDTTATELAVFFFGPGQGGDVEANITRWVGQIHTPDGAAPEVERTETTISGVRVTRIEATGTLAATTMGNPQPERPDHRLIGAIAEGPQGPVFFKMTTPNGDAARAEAAFDALIASIHPG